MAGLFWKTASNSSNPLPIRGIPVWTNRCNKTDLGRRIQSVWSQMHDTEACAFLLSSLHQILGGCSSQLLTTKTKEASIPVGETTLHLMGFKVLYLTQGKEGPGPDKQVWFCTDGVKQPGKQVYALLDKALLIIHHWPSTESINIPQQGGNPGHFVVQKTTSKAGACLKATWSVWEWVGGCCTVSNISDRTHQSSSLDDEILSCSAPKPGPKEPALPGMPWDKEWHGKTIPHIVGSSLKLTQTCCAEHRYVARSPAVKTLASYSHCILQLAGGFQYSC